MRDKSISMLKLAGANRFNSESPISCDLCPLARLTVYGPTVCANYAQITNLRKEIRHLAADRVITRHGETPNLLYAIQSGWAFQFRTLPDGRRQVLSFLIPGDVISLELLLWDALALPYGVKSATAVRLCAFEKTAFKAVIAKSDAQARKLAEDATSYMDNALRRTTDIGRRSANGRLAQLILELMDRLTYRRLGDNRSFPLPLKQAHIADALGLTAIYVNRILTNFRKKMIVDFDRHSMTVLNLAALRTIADED